MLLKHFLPGPQIGNISAEAQNLLDINSTCIQLLKLCWLQDQSHQFTSASDLSLKTCPKLKIVMTETWESCKPFSPAKSSDFQVAALYMHRTNTRHFHSCCVCFPPPPNLYFSAEPALEAQSISYFIFIFKSIHPSRGFLTTNPQAFCLKIKFEFQEHVTHEQETPYYSSLMRWTYSLKAHSWTRIYKRGWGGGREATLRDAHCSITHW